MSDELKYSDEAPMTLGAIDADTERGPDVVVDDLDLETPEEGHDLEEDNRTESVDEVAEDAESVDVPAESTGLAFADAMEAAASGLEVRRAGWLNRHALVTDRGEGLILAFDHRRQTYSYTPLEVDEKATDWVVLQPAAEEPIEE